MMQFTLDKRRGTFFRGIAVATAGLVALSIAGCSAEVAEKPEGTESASPHIQSDALTVSTRMADYLPGYGMLDADAIPYSSVSEMAEDADLGASGTIASFSWGRFDRHRGEATDSVDYEPIIVKLEDPEVLSGDLPHDFDGNLYIALPGFGTLEEHEQGLPIGTRVTFYGIDLEQPGLTLLEGAPEGQNVYNVIHPASLAVEVPAVDVVSRSAIAGETVVVFPLAGVVAPDVQLDDVEPGDQLPDFDALAEEQHG
ncbi:hypothetical protein [Microbacterium sp. NPDC096154]|uniref:hypothetical protein n=1 Tax=Microbacterium sp. NPDC096154 TaxID=3155549 RepID=UPI00331F78A0